MRKMWTWRRPAVMAVAIVLCSSAARTEVRAETRSAASRQSPSISGQTFLASPFARAFQAGDYAGALKALNALAKIYPDDPLILRYRAVTLARLGRTKEAIAVYRRLLARNPAHVPTHIFLGQAYRQAGQNREAADQWRWVAEHSDSAEYRRWAEAQLHRLRVKAKTPLSKRRPYVFAATGFKYDSNPLFKPNDKALAKSGNEKPASSACWI